MLLKSFNVVGLMIPEKKNFEGVFAIYGCGGHLGHVTKVPRKNMCPLDP